MGFSSYECKSCGHSILHPGSVDPEINAWMKDAVILGESGSRLVTEFEGYAGEYEDLVGSNAVWLHQACWEVAGKPEYGAFDGPSQDARDQGHFFNDEHDMIDPRITDEAERARLLKGGRRQREEARFAQKARDIHDWLEELQEAHGRFKKDPWRVRYSIVQMLLCDADDVPVRDKDGELVYDARSWIYMDRLEDDGEHLFSGTKDELKAHLASEWAAFLESDRCKDMLVYRENEIEEMRAERLEKAKVEGRFTTTYGPEYDEDGNERWPVHRVMDSLEYRTDKEGFYGDNSRERAQAKADMLNAAWAKAGYPQEFKHEAFEDQFAREDAA